MNVKLCIDFDGTEDIDAVCEMLHAAKHGHRGPILDRTTPCTVVPITVNAVTQGDTAVVLYDPMALAGLTPAQNVSVNLYVSTGTYFFSGSSISQTLVIPRLQNLATPPPNPNNPSYSTAHVIQTTGVAGLPPTQPTATAPMYFTTFSAVTTFPVVTSPPFNPYIFRFAMQTPAAMANPPGYQGVPTLYASGNPTCVYEDVINNSQRVFKVTWPDSTSSYVIWRKICTGGMCDSDFTPQQGTAQPFFPTVQDLFIQIFS